MIFKKKEEKLQQKSIFLTRIGKRKGRDKRREIIISVK